LKDLEEDPPLHDSILKNMLTLLFERNADVMITDNFFFFFFFFFFYAPGHSALRGNSR